MGHFGLHVGKGNLAFSVEKNLHLLSVGKCRTHVGVWFGPQSSLPIPGKLSSPQRSGWGTNTYKLTLSS